MNIYARHDRFEEKTILFYDKTGKAFNPFYQVSRDPGKSRPSARHHAALPRTQPGVSSTPAKAVKAAAQARRGVTARAPTAKP